MAKRHGTLGLIGRAALALGIAVAGYLFVYRPQQLRWGATDEEVARALPGDEIQAHPVFDATRSITIDAPPDEVWPWIVQIGYLRAGWYGLDLLDNDGVPSAREIVPEYQSLRVGDKLPIWKIAFQRVAAIEPNRYLLTRGDDDTTWVWALYPAGERQTRLVWRMRSAPYSWTSPYIAPQLFTDAVDLIAVREALLGIKERAEGQHSNTTLPYVEVALWLASFVGYLVASVGILRWRSWPRAALAAAGSSLVTIGLVLGRPPVPVDALGAAVVSAGLLWAKRSARRERSAGRT